MKEHAHFAAASSVLADLPSDSNRVTRRAAGGHRKTDRRAVSGNFCHDASEPEHDLACDRAASGNAASVGHSVGCGQADGRQRINRQ